MAEPGLRPVGTDDLPHLVDVERDAGEAFRSLGMEQVADADPGSVEDLSAYADDGRAFVARREAALPGSNGG